MTSSARHSPLIIALALIHSACGGSSHASVPTQTRMETPPTERDQAEASDRSPYAAPPIPATLARPDAFVCSWHTEAWRPAGAVPSLSLAPNGPPFAYVVGSPSAEIGLLSGAPPTLWIRAAHAGSDVTGVLSGSSLPLFATRAVAIQDWTVAMQFRFLAGQGARIDVEADTPEQVRPVAPLRATLECDSFSVDWTELDPYAAAGLRAEGGTAGYLNTTADLPLRATPRGEVRAMLAPQERAIQILERRGNQTRVVIDYYSLLVFGWIPAANAEPSAIGTGGLGLSGTGAGGGGDAITCRRPIPLIVEVAGSRATVGTIAAGTRLDVADRASDIAFELDWLRPAENARFVLPAELASACGAAPPVR